MSSKPIETLIAAFPNTAWKLLSHAENTQQNITAFEFTELQGCNQFIFTGDWAANSAGYSGVDININGVWVIGAGTYFVHPSQHKYATITLNLLPGKRIWYSGMSATINEPYNQDGLNVGVIVPIPNMAESIISINFNLHNASTSILAGANYALYGRVDDV